MDSIFLTAVHNLHVVEPLGRGFQFAEGLYLTNDKERITQLVTPELRAAMGVLEYENLVQRSHVLYLEGELVNDIEPNEAVKIFLDHIHTIFKALWLVKDNAVNCELAFLELARKRPLVTWSSNLKAILYTTSRGDSTSTIFNLDELRQARIWLQDHLVPLIFPGKGGEAMVSSGVGSKSVPRLIRLLYFLTSARSADDLGVKVATYMTCLEILFSTSPTEIIHKIAERVAYLLSPTVGERVGTFAFIKRAYDVRSKIVHGATLSSRLEREMPDLCERLDSLVRHAVVKFFQEQELRALTERSVEKIEEYYMAVVLGAGGVDSN